MLRFMILALTLSWSAPALACWDGTYAVVGRVELSSDELEWSTGQVVATATWLGRIDAVLPDDASLRIDHGTATVEYDDGTSFDVSWSGDSLEALFVRVAHETGASPDRVRAARRHVTPVFTVQVAALPGREAAERLTTLIEGEHGFLEVGGFPADNPTAHVVEEGGAHVVLVGAFLDRSEAAAVASAIGPRAFVRQL